MNGKKKDRTFLIEVPIVGKAIYKVHATDQATAMEAFQKRQGKPDEVCTTEQFTELSFAEIINHVKVPAEIQIVSYEAIDDLQPGKYITQWETVRFDGTVEDIQFLGIVMLPEKNREIRSFLDVDKCLEWLMKKKFQRV